MTGWISVGISALALCTSAVTAWLTLFRRGALSMTQPTVLFIGPDGPQRGLEHPHIKVFLRTLLYSTSRSGQVVESMFVNLQRAESRQNFSVWVYGEDRLERGSGLYVGLDGVVCNHHFLLPRDGVEFILLPGQYVVRVFAKRTRDRDPRQLAEIPLQISESQASELKRLQAGIYFDWGPDQQAYHAHVELLPPEPILGLSTAAEQTDQPDTLRS